MNTYSQIVSFLERKEQSLSLHKRHFSSQKDSVSSPREISQKIKKDIKILIIEDDELSQYILKNLLDNKGVTYDLIDNEFKALSKIERYSYDLILLGCQLQGMDVNHWISWVRGRDMNAHIPIIICSATRIEEEEIQAFGLDGFLHKPVKKQELYQLISTQTLKSIS
ncbi:MAG: response regulator [Bacteroidota bacterium]